MKAEGLAELIHRSRAPEKGAPPEPEDAAEEYPCFAKLRSQRQTGIMLELQLGPGESEALDYGYLMRARFDPSAGILLHFGTTLVTITGRCLRPLFDAIITHRALWARLPLDAATIARDPEATVITGIEIHPK